MKKKDRIRGNFRITLYEIIAGFAAIILMLYVIYACFFLPTDHKETGYHFELRNEWTLTTPDTVYRDVDLPVSVPMKAGELLLLERILPERIEGTDCIAFREVHQNIKVYIDDELREEYDFSKEKLKWNNPISRTMYIELTPEDAHAHLRIEGVSPKDGKRTVSKVYYGDKAGIFFNYARMQLWGIIFGIFFLAIGIVGIVAGQILRIATRGRVRADSIGWAMLIVAIWNAAQSNYREIFFPNLGMAKAIPFFALAVLPMFMANYLDWIQNRRHQKLLGTFVLVCFANLIFWTVLVVTRVASPEDSVWVAFALLYTVFLLCVFTYISDAKSGVTEGYLEVLVGFIAGAIGGFAQIIVYLFGKGNTDGMCLGAGFTVLTCMVFLNATKMLMRLRLAKESAETKSRFLTAMSHELRTPINAIMGMNEVIMHESTEENIVSYAKDVDEAGHLLLHLVNDILDFTKIDSGKMKLVPETFEIKKCVMVCYSIVSTRARDKALDIRVNIDKDMPSLFFGDEVRLQQVIINILSNAVKYTDKGSVTANFTFERHNEREILLKMVVEDTGRGIKKEELENLFEDYSRADERANHKIEGSGLGLAITKGIIGLMKGTIEVQSTYGEGSCFIIKIPMQVMSWDKVGLFDVRQENTKEETDTQDDKAVSFEGLNMLVVDDVEMNLKVFVSLLKNLGANIDCALNGMNGISLCKKKKYDIIFMDHMMPELDGIKTMKTIKESADSLNKSTSIVVMTANATDEAEYDYLDEGFDDYIIKPVGLDRLKKVIARNIKPAKANH